MTFASIANGTAVFVDANIFVYSFGPDPQFGPPCQKLIERIEIRHLQGFTSSQVLSDVAHRLMSLEACAIFGWPYAGIAARMQRHAAEVRQLTRFRQAIDAIRRNSSHAGFRSTRCVRSDSKPAIRIACKRRFGCSNDAGKWLNATCQPRC